jgi:hypothetical protein
LVKPLAAAVVMQLEQQGVLGVDDRLRSYSSWNRGSTGIESISIEQLLTHTSGVRDYELADAAPVSARSASDAIRLVEPRLYSTPGRVFSYSALGYLALEALIEAVTQASFDEALRACVLAPLEIGAQGENEAGFVLPNVGRNLRLSCAELATLAASLLGAGPARPRLTASQWARMRAAAAPMPGPCLAFESWSLGWGRVCRGVFGHNGATADARLVVRLEPSSGRALAVAAPYDCAPALAHALARELFGVRWVPARACGARRARAACAGTYRLQRGGLLVVTRHGDQLRGRLGADEPHGQLVTLEPLSGGQFVLLDARRRPLELCAFVATEGGRRCVWNGLQLDSRVDDRETERATRTARTSPARPGSFAS